MSTHQNENDRKIEKKEIIIKENIKTNGFSQKLFTYIKKKTNRCIESNFNCDQHMLEV